VSRTYSMSTRDAARAHTRTVILDAATEHFADAWYDQITLSDVARAAGVSQQTVLNHFGSKLGLYLAAVRERRVPQIRAIRDRAIEGDVGSVVRAVTEDYELTGDSTVRAVALAEREPELAEVIEGGRVSHRAWVETLLRPQLASRRGGRRDRLLNLLVAVLDVSTWHQLRRVQGLSRDDVVDHLTDLVEAVVRG
jgi:AcrR family transcriptional regulator